MHSLSQFLVPALLIVAASGVACGSNSSTGSGFDNPRPSNRSTGGGAGDHDTAGDEDGVFNGSDAGATDGEAFCQTVQSTVVATAAPSNILFLIDRSGSMHITLTDVTKTRWTETKAGLISVLGTLSPTTRAGAMMFPQGDQPIASKCCGIDPVLNDVKCDYAACTMPAPAARCAESTYKTGIGIGTLDGAQMAAIGTYIAASDQEFYWGTPMAPALRAAVGSMRAATVDGVKSVILLTDGIPSSCGGVDDDIQAVVSAAAAGATNAKPVKTYVLGVIDGTKGARAENLAAVAKAGGTDHHYGVNVATFAKDLASAFQQIATQSFDCSFTLPPAAQGTMRDPSKVNVQISDGAAKEVVLRDAAHQSGWDYVAGASDKIKLYGEACNAIKSDPLKKVEILVGCSTVIR